MMLIKTRKSKSYFFRLTALALLVVAAMTLLVACGGGSDVVERINNDLDNLDNMDMLPDTPTCEVDQTVLTGNMCTLPAPDLGSTTLTAADDGGCCLSGGGSRVCSGGVTNLNDVLIVTSVPTGCRIDSLPGIADLIISSRTVSDSTLTTGGTFTLSATVRNQGTGSSAATILRYYRSVDSMISLLDTQVGADSVDVLAASATSPESITLTPSSAGTYYYGACVASVPSESEKGNNCSTGVMVVVTGPTINVPSHPTGLTGQFSPSDFFVDDSVSLILNWNLVSDATSYKVYIVKLPSWTFRYTELDSSCTTTTELASTVEQTSYMQGFRAGFSNYFSFDVQACNSAGCSCPP